MARFDNKRVLITGGTSGMGLAGAKRIVAEGGTVIATGLNPDRISSTQHALGDRAMSSRVTPAILPALRYWSRRRPGPVGLMDCG